MALAALAGQRFTVDQYHRMIASGVLGEGDAVELLEGLILHKGAADESGEPVPYRFSERQCLKMVEAGIVSEEDAFALAELGVESEMPRSPAHDSAIDRADDAIRRLLPGKWRIRCQSAIKLAGGEPEPDLAVVRGPAGRYDTHHPTPSEIAFLVEVSDATLAYDRGIKLRAYAAAEIPAYWIVNLIERRIEVYTEPRKPRRVSDYAERSDFHASQGVPVAIMGTAIGSIPVDSLLPPL